MAANTNSYLDKLRLLVASDMQLVDETIKQLVASYVDLIPEICLHTISAGGKRLRPMLTLATSKLCGYKGQIHIDLATIVEFIHTATLLHDDVVDISKLRRGAKTANEVWGNKESILVGDFLLGRAFYLMARAQSLEIYEILSQAAMVISEGEVRQLMVIGNLNLKEEEYIEIIGAKTAELFAASCEISAVLSEVEIDKQNALKEYGYYLGLAFQITDDVLDYCADEELLGKNIGDDFREGKVTLPLLLAYKMANLDEKIALDKIFLDLENIADHTNIAIELIKKYKTPEKSMLIAKNYALAAKNSLAIFPNNKAKEALILLLDFVTEREF